MTQPRLNLFDTDPAELAVDAVVIGLHRRAEDQDELLVSTGSESIVAAFDGRLTDTLRMLGATGNPGEVTKLATLGTITAPVVVAVGLGPEPTGAAPPPEKLRRAAGAAVRALTGQQSVALALPVPDDAGLPAAVRALAEGALLGTYRFETYKSTPSRWPVPSEVSIHVPDADDSAAQSELERATVVAGAVRRARDWVNTAPNDLRPPQFAERIAEVATEAGLSVEVLDEQALREGGFNGILAVGSGSAAPPRLVRLAYTP